MRIFKVTKDQDEVIAICTSKAKAEEIRKQYFSVDSRKGDWIQIYETATNILWNY